MKDLRNSWLAFYVDGGTYLRYDTEDSTSQENYYTYLEIQEELATCGLALNDFCIEHNCISGELGFIEVHYERI